MGVRVVWRVIVLYMEGRENMWEAELERKMFRYGSVGSDVKGREEGYVVELVSEICEERECQGG